MRLQRFHGFAIAGLGRPVMPSIIGCEGP
jgi:hypothetical protein